MIGWIASLPIALLLLVGIPMHASASHSEDLARLCDEYWQGTLRTYPSLATVVGDHRYDDQLEDISPAARKREQQRLAGVLARAEAIAVSALSPGDRVTQAALILECRNGLDQISCGFDAWTLDPLGGPQVGFMNQGDIAVIRTPREAARYVERCRKMGAYLDQHIANLTRGLEAGRVAARDPARKVLDEVEGLLHQPIGKWGLLLPLGARHEGWTDADRAKFRRDLTAAAEQVVKPALGRFRDFLERRILPAARPPEKPGLAFIPGGKDCYAKRIRIETSLEKSPEELHRIGLDEVKRIRAALSELGGRALGTTDVAEIQRKLRGDPAMHFGSPEQVEAKARETLARAKAAIPQWFGVLPKAECQVKVMGMHEAPNSTIAYYRQPAQDGSRPGTYMINTYKPETRTRYEAEALAFHESIPGHHLQIAIAQELTGVPEFRKHQGVTAYVEGWALYTERLAEEMGLYSGDLDRIGELSFDAWRACRLVVDTGLHAMGWSRQQAIDYMTANTVLAENNIANEVDRYITWPGQALAYKVGQLEILALRDRCRTRLGTRFDIKGFHDAVLRNGAVSLPELDRQVEAWCAGIEAAK